jgi:hypothetical protein
MLSGIGPHKGWTQVEVTHNSMVWATRKTPRTVLTRIMSRRLGLVGSADGAARSAEIGIAVRSANRAMSTWRVTSGGVGQQHTVDPLRHVHAHTHTHTHTHTAIRELERWELKHQRPHMHTTPAHAHIARTCTHTAVQIQHSKRQTRALAPTAAQRLCAFQT